MKVSDLFILHQGNGLELLNMELSENSEINFVSRTAQNNGVVSQVELYGDLKPFKAGLITISLGGSVLASFVQLNPFYTAYHVMVLEPKLQMSFNEKMFYCMCISKNAYRYSYGRQANRTLKDIELPERVPAWVGKISISHITTTTKQEQFVKLNVSAWKDFQLQQIFNFKKGKRLTKEDMNEGRNNYIGAISDNNGVRQLIDAAPIFSPNCITVNYNGSVGEAFYQSEPFWASDDVNVLYAKDWKLNKYIALFIITIIKANRYRFGYGRKWTLEKMKESIIKLPTKKNGKPNWAYMERYIMSLPYSDKI